MGQRGAGHVFVVSALYGVTDLLISGMDEAMAGEEKIPEIISRIRDEHMRVAAYLIGDENRLKEYQGDLAAALEGWSVFITVSILPVRSHPRCGT